ncbi:iron-containing alcohol dehydrogenase [Variovorax sp. UMC13]|uniref:iron-containing alcohol dehydrogenase n=1 Tax=Variovorax sp. UMC13 TaxID=1862326 RepID=UPI001604302D|nr:iron-containing alcohol dehydrogenase [Variovorax sp. UMC13]MBB1598801.1 alcohol dehydrogenase [Variovorax sp. UMC13]
MPTLTPTGIHSFPAIERVRFGQPAAAAVAVEAAQAGAQRVFIMASRTLNTRTEAIREIEAALGERHAGTYDGMPQHTTRSGVSRAALAAQEAGADLIVAVGGGSVIDGAKMVTLCLRHGMTDEHLEALDRFEVKLGDDGKPVRPVFDGPTVRMVAVPSTLNGGEFNAGCLVTDERRKHKQTFFHIHMMPRAIVLDPALTLHTPETLWLGSATRALDHAIEALLSVTPTPLADAVVLSGIARMAAVLPKWQAAPHDLALRAECQIASWLCSYGLSSRGAQGGVMMGPSHAIGHVLGGTCGVPHYHCTPVLMPAVLRWSESATADRQRLLAQALGQPALSASEAFARLVASLGLPANLRAVGVDESRFDEIAKISMHEIFTRGNARQITTPADVREILALAA